MGGYQRKIFRMGILPKELFCFHNSSNTFNIDGFASQTLLIGKMGEFRTPPLLLLYQKSK